MKQSLRGNAIGKKRNWPQNDTILVVDAGSAWCSQWNTHVATNQPGVLDRIEASTKLNAVQQHFVEFGAVAATRLMVVAVAAIHFVEAVGATHVDRGCWPFGRLVCAGSAIADDFVVLGVGVGAEMLGDAGVPFADDFLAQQRAEQTLPR